MAPNKVTAIVFCLITHLDGWCSRYCLHRCRCRPHPLHPMDPGSRLTRTVRTSSRDVWRWLLTAPAWLTRSGRDATRRPGQTAPSLASLSMTSRCMTLRRGWATQIAWVPRTRVGSGQSAGRLTVLSVGVATLPLVAGTPAVSAASLPRPIEAVFERRPPGRALSLDDARPARLQRQGTVIGEPFYM